MKKILAIFTILLLPLPALAGACRANDPSTMPSGCGEKLKKDGWKEIARCDDGHQWAYVVKKVDVQQVCKGINALGGPEEDPCTAYDIDLKAFAALSDATQKQKDAYNAASKAGRLDAFLAERNRSLTPPRNCWELAR